MGFKKFFPTATTETKTEQTAQVTNEPEAETTAQETKTETVEDVPTTTPSPTPSTAPSTDTAQTETADDEYVKTIKKRIEGIKELVDNGTIIGSKEKDADGLVWAVFRLADGVSDIKEKSYIFKYFNAKWEFNEDKSLKFVKIPAAVLKNVEAAKLAHEERKEKVAKIKERTFRKSNATSNTTHAEKSTTNGNSRCFTEAQVRSLLKQANTTLSDDVISLMIKSIA